MNVVSEKGGEEATVLVQGLCCLVSDLHHMDHSARGGRFLNLQLDVMAISEVRSKGRRRPSENFVLQFKAFLQPPVVSC